MIENLSGCCGAVIIFLLLVRDGGELLVLRKLKFREFVYNNHCVSFVVNLPNKRKLKIIKFIVNCKRDVVQFGKKINIVEIKLEKSVLLAKRRSYLEFIQLSKLNLRNGSFNSPHLHPERGE